MKRWLLHPWLTTRSQIALGLVFVIAALGKIQDPPAFAKAIWNYQLAPIWSIHPAALVLPWLELFCGIALCLGLWVRTTTLWILGLLTVFTLALSINLARHRPVDCGCFSLAGPAKTEAERLVDLRWAILRDLGLMLLAGQILFAAREPKPE